MKPHELLRQAVADMLLCDEDPGYSFNMMMYFSPEIDGVCLICLAGAYMAQTLKVDRVSPPRVFQMEEKSDLYFLDIVRYEYTHENFEAIKEYTGLDLNPDTYPHPQVTVAGIEDTYILLERADWLENDYTETA